MEMDFCNLLNELSFCFSREISEGVLLTVFLSLDRNFDLLEDLLTCEVTSSVESLSKGDFKDRIAFM
jgi:hypothetical protein